MIYKTEGNLLFELLRVSTGVQNGLPEIPSFRRWEEIYAMAEKQSVLGICFAGVSMLTDHDGNDYAGMPEDLYYEWMGVALQIQRRNEIVNRQCGELSARFWSDGYKAIILKGQGLAKLYEEPLRKLRQPGDIDIWLDGTRRDIKDYLNLHFPVGKVIYNHAHVHVYDDTEVEVHFTPSWLYNPFKNRQLQIWFKQYRVDGFEESKGFRSPDIEFNLVYLLLHNFRHLLHEGLGMRQVVDYYFVMKSTLTENPDFDTIMLRMKSVQETVSEFGLKRFAEAMMWVIQKVFELDLKMFPWAPDEKRGKRLLKEIMRGGNMGRGDNRTGNANTRFGYFLEHICRQWSFLFDYPGEVLWSPIWKSWHFAVRIMGRI